MPTITVNAADLIAKFTKLSQFKRLRARLKAAAVHVQGKIATYPDAGGKPAEGWMAKNVWTDKQRKWFFANLHDGNIAIPYRRTMQLQHKWTTASRDSGFTQVIGNSAKYAQLVQGKEQTRYHAQTGWKTADQVIEQERETVTNYILEGINEDLAEV